MPSLHDAELTYADEYPVLGVPLQVATNSATALALAEESFARWRTLAPELLQPGPPARFGIVVGSRPGEPPGGGPLTVRQRGDLLVAAAGSVMLTLRLSARHAVAFVPESVPDNDPAWFRWFVNAFGIHAAAQRDRFPIHASAVVVNGVLCLLLGGSGAGKSTLAYAAVRDGHRLLAEDTVFVALAGGLRYWAHTERLSLNPDTARWFDELAGRPTLQMPNGKVRLPVPLEAFRIEPLLTHAGSAMLLGLRRDVGRPRSEPCAAEALLAPLRAQHEPGFDLVNHQAEPVLAALAALPAYRLTPGDDPRSAVALLEALAAENGGVAIR